MFPPTAEVLVPVVFLVGGAGREGLLRQSGPEVLGVHEVLEARFLALRSGAGQGEV